MFQEYVVRPMVWNTLPRELQRTFMHLCSSGYNFPLRQFVNFSTLVRDTSERSKVFAQRKCAIGLDKVELLRMLAVFYQNKHNPRDFLEVQLLLLGFGSSLLLYFWVTASVKPSSLLPLKFSWCLVLIHASIRVLKTWKAFWWNLWLSQIQEE